MEMDLDVLYQAILTRDFRFDGRFYVGVKTTGIYCRTICPAKPKKENIEFFPDRYSAEKAGYRPCLRCRPECAPNSPAWIGRSSTVNRAVKLIANNILLESNQDKFADQLGVSARHLTRLFKEELGKTPKQISDINRLNFARKLIVETRLAITEIAFTSGFSSIRRFNQAFKNRFRRSPTYLRNRNHKTTQDLGIHLSLSYRPPLDWKSVVQFYRSHEIFGVELIKHSSYSRVFKLDGVIGAFEISQHPTKPLLDLRVIISDTKSLYQIVQNIRMMFDLDSDPVLISGLFLSHALMSKLNRKHMGLRLPRGWDPFETSVCAILGQLVSTEQARRLIEQLVTAYGEEIQNPLTDEKTFLFPTAQTLATESLSKVGTTNARKETIREFSRLVLTKKIGFDLAQDIESLKKSLLSIKGIGPWTAEYICLRALGDSDSFPKTDLILKRVLKQNTTLKIDDFKPWRSYAAIYLWKEYAKLLSKKKVKNNDKFP